MSEVKVLPNFISKNDCDVIISFMNSIMSKMVFDGQKGRHIIKFGYDQEFDSHGHSLDILAPIAGYFNDIFYLVENKINEEYNPPPLFLSSFFLSKHVNGGAVPPHADANNDINSHLKYTAMIYLNNSDGSGRLHFPKLDITITPTAGMLVIFPANDEMFMHGVSEISHDRYSMPMWFTEEERYIIA